MMRYFIFIAFIFLAFHLEAQTMVSKNTAVQTENEANGTIVLKEHLKPATESMLLEMSKKKATILVNSNQLDNTSLIPQSNSVSINAKLIPYDENDFNQTQKPKTTITVVSADEQNQETQLIEIRAILIPVD